MLALLPFVMRRSARVQAEREPAATDAHPTWDRFGTSAGGDGGGRQRTGTQPEDVLDRPRRR